MKNLLKKFRDRETKSRIAIVRDSIRLITRKDTMMITCCGITIAVLDQMCTINEALTLVHKYQEIAINNIEW